MKISIVVPVYNADKFLDKSIQSVINQTNPNWELVLIDDGSTDKSGEICDSYAEKYDNIFVFHKDNEGQFLTRQLGIEKATGEYIGFLDADDELSDDYVSSILKCIKESDNPSVICFGFTEYKGESNIEHNLLKDKVCYISNVDDKNYMIQLILGGNLSGAMWSKVFSSELLLNIKIDSSYVKDKRFGEDAYQSYSIILYAKSVAILNKSLYVYNRLETGASLGFDHREFDYFNTRYVHKVLFDILKKWNIKNKDNLNKLIAANFNESVYYILKYFRSSKDKKRKRDCVKFDWSSYLLETDINIISKNPYVRKSYIKVYKAFMKKRYFYILLRERFGW